MNVLICSCLHYFVPYLYRFKNSSAKIGGYHFTWAELYIFLVPIGALWWYRFKWYDGTECSAM